jgi:hypothetical protein
VGGVTKSVQAAGNAGRKMGGALTRRRKADLSAELDPKEG